ncbi:MAG: efflux RND transporter permease subunit [Gammaproteobacteria bacterium]|nr:MAG: efflux RND transporter permease subunit [Gammaproteobacteria bacterium]TLZ48246.1 MAG: efflux RND transporter permease subunit [Gammaproteobacteria bacterium]
MLAAIVRWSLRFPAVVCVLAGMLALYGVLVLARAKYDVFPEFVPPQAAVQTEAPGLVAEQVELLVTLPIEQAISGASGVQVVRSETISGLSVVTVVFQENLDPYRARQIVAEALGQVTARLPLGVKPPKLEPLTSSTMDLLKLGFVSEALSPMQLRDLVQWTIRPRLLAVPGVARATLYGGDERQLQVQVEPRELNARDLAFGDVVAAVRSATGVRGGGFIETPNQRVLIESRGQTLDVAALGAAVVPAASAAPATLAAPATPAAPAWTAPPLRLRDFATVTDGVAPKFGDTLIMGRPGVLLNLSSQYGANTLIVTRAVEAALAELAPALRSRSVTLYPGLHRPANFIENALAGIRLDVLLGAVLITLVLFLFLRDLRSVAVTFVSIPLALLAAVIVVDAVGWTINTMTLGGLAVALGVVVDDAIIGVENIVRRLRGTHAHGLEAREVIHNATVEVRAPVVYATFVVVLVLAPMLLLSGLQGSFFAPLAASFSLATLASLLVALTVTPAAAWLLLRRTEPHAEAAWLTRLKDRHEALLRRWSAFPRRVIIGSALVTLLAAAALPLFGSELMPPFREGHFVVQAYATPGTSLTAMRALGARVARDLLAIPGIVTVEQTMGRAESGEDTWEPNRSEFHVELGRMSGRAEEATQAAIRAALQHYPSLRTEVLTFLGDRLSESLSGEVAPVAVNVFGPDLDELDRVADEIAAVARTVPGASDVQVQAPSGAPFLRVDLRPEQLGQYGFTAADVLDTVETAYQGTTAAQVYDANKVIDLTVRLPPAERVDPEAIGQLLVRTANGVTVPLKDLATLSLTEGRTGIMHEGARRRQVVTLNPTTSDIGGFVARLQKAVARRVQLPPTVYLDFAGAASGERQARHELLVHSGLAALGIMLLLSLAFRDARSVLLILATAPFALVGGVLAVALTGATLSIGSLVGFVTLFGIVARNAILLIAHLGHLLAVEGAQWSLPTVLRSTRERLVPILMTALVTALGLLPLALGSGEAGREVQGPMASVILGGLATSTLMTLVVLPILIWRFGPLARADATGAR